MSYAELIQNDEETVLFQLTKANGSDPVDLTGDTVRIKLYYQGDEVDPGVVSSANGVEVTNYVSREKGRVSYQFNAEDLAYTGTYVAQFEVDDGSASTYYPKKKLADSFPLEVYPRAGVATPGEIGAQGSLTGPLDAAGNDITGGGRFEADVIVGGIFEDRSSGNQADLDTILAGFPSVSDDTTQVSPGAPDLNAGTGLEAVNDGDDSITFNVIGGGSGTSLDITDGTTFVTAPTELGVTTSGAASADVQDDGDGTATLDIGATDTDTHIDVEDGGTALASDISTLNLGNNLSGSESGGTVTVSASSDGGGSTSVDDAQPLNYEEVPAGGKITRLWLAADAETVELTRARLIVHDGDMVDGSGSVVTDGNVSIQWRPPAQNATTVISNNSVVNIDDSPGFSYTATGNEAGFILIRNASTNDYNVGFDVEVV